MRERGLAAAALIVWLAAPGAAGAGDRVWVGGGVGLSFGTVDYVEVAPIVGFSATDELSLGGGLTYRYRKDDRYARGLSTSDYGANLFLRYRFVPSLFGHAEVEHLSYEYVRPDLSRDRDGFNSLLVGPGFSQPVGNRGAFYALALYNLSYDTGDLRSPYDQQWVYRAGFTVGF